MGISQSLYKGKVVKGRPCMGGWGINPPAPLGFEGLRETAWCWPPSLAISAGNCTPQGRPGETETADGGGCRDGGGRGRDTQHLSAIPASLLLAANAFPPTCLRRLVISRPLLKTDPFNLLGVCLSMYVDVHTTWKHWCVLTLKIPGLFQKPKGKYPF